MRESVWEVVCLGVSFAGDSAFSKGVVGEVADGDVALRLLLALPVKAAKGF